MGFEKVFDDLAFKHIDTYEGNPLSRRLSFKLLLLDTSGGSYKRSYATFDNYYQS